jgi:hypothetical protein
MKRVNLSERMHIDQREEKKKEMKNEKAELPKTFRNITATFFSPSGRLSET